MTQVNISDAKEKFGDWVNLLKSKEQDEIILTEDGKPTIKMTFLENDPTEKKSSNKRQLGIATGKFFYDSDFWEEHDEKFGRIAY